MDRLPLELLREICLGVTPQYRAAFRNMNRYIRNAFDYNFSFGSLTLITPEQVQYFRTHPHLADAVRNLEVLQLLENLVNRREFLRIFPNAEMIRVERARGQQPDMLWPNYIEDAVSAQPRIVHDFDHCDLVCHIIFNQLGNNLTTLDLNFGEVRSSGTTMAGFADMPQLLTVHLRHARFELRQLETMHRNCGSIRTLTLQEARILQVAQPQHIPTYLPIALSNLTLSFHNGTGANAVGYMCQYVMQKYQGLQHIDFSQGWHDGRRRTNNIRQLGIVRHHGYEEFLQFVDRIQNPVL